MPHGPGADFAKLQQEQKRLVGKLHGEAWMHRLRGELESMLEKQELARRALRMSRSYDYLRRKLA
jgi:hypothetical protein